MPATAASAGTIRLSVPDAVQRALREGTTARLAQTSRERAAIAEREALGGLLPQAGAKFIRSSESVNLETFGFAVPGEPPVVGPFDVSDARISAAVQLFNLAALRRYQALRSLDDAGGFRLRQAENDVIEAVTRLYVMGARAEARVTSRQAEVALFEKLLHVAQDEFDAGTATRLDVAQAKLQLAQARQALLSAENDTERARLALLDAIGAEPSDSIELTDELSSVDAVPGLGVALAAAGESRPELRVAETEKAAAKLELASMRARRYPRVEIDFQGDESGNSLENLYWSRTIAAMVTMPVFDTTINANIARARLDLEDAQTRADDTRRRVEQEVRQALLELEHARARVDVATEAVAVADQALEIARDRKAAGYGSTVEVDRAQEAYSRAHENLIAARADAALAGYSLEHATGEIHRFVETAE